MLKQIIQTDNAPRSIGPYSQAIKIDKTFYLSGQIPINPNAGKIIAKNFRDQVIQVFKNIEAILDTSGGSLTNLIKINVYITNLKFFSELNEVMAECLKQPYPARVVLEVARLPRDALIAVDGIAIIE